ncbi:MAG: long-chain fatty acid--CoA ligase [Candidatus Omnitrophica bacterium]|nr:long-chain fatty acid--CoA ligase [Candidatus Omnitrophota bacterium]
MAGSGHPLTDQTLPALFARQAGVLKSETLFLAKRGGAYQPITWQQAADDLRAVSCYLLQQGLEPGDRVLLLSENRPEWGIADLAIQSVGAWTVPIYPSLTGEGIQAICRDCRPVVGIASTSEQAAKLLAAGQATVSFRAIVVMEGVAQAGQPLVVPWAAALTQGRAAHPELRERLTQRQDDLRPDQTATLIYTSGTTGEPKGVMLSHRNFLSNVEACLQVIAIRGRDTHLSFLPLCHVFERMAGWYLMMAVGARIAYAESMDTIPQNMLEVRPTVMLGVPRFFEKLYLRIQDGLRQVPPAKRRVAEWALRVGQAAATCTLAGRSIPAPLRLQRALADALVFRTLRSRLGGRLRFIVSGSAPLSKEIGEFFYSVGVTILEGYGLTETSPVIAVNRPPVPRFGSVGPPLAGVEVRIAEDGEILTRGPHVMQGYYGKPEATAEVLADGWLHTGDIGHLDAEGYLVITDRKKDLIKTAGGKFVAPQKLEGLFVTDPHISQVFVYGDRRPYCVALLVPNMDHLRRYAQQEEIAAASAAELVRDPRVLAFYWGLVQAKQHGLPSFEQVKRIALLDQEFSQAAGELTPTLKAKRNVIAQRYAEELEALYQQPAP